MGCKRFFLKERKIVTFLNNGFVCRLQAAGYPRWAYFSYPIYMQSVNWSTAESLVRNSEADRARA